MGKVGSGAARVHRSGAPEQVAGLGVSPAFTGKNAQQGEHRETRAALTQKPSAQALGLRAIATLIGRDGGLEDGFGCHRGADGALECRRDKV